jgi:molecular chaperone GrpE
MTQENAAENTPPPEEAPAASADAARVAELEQLLAATHEKMLRALAEAQNTRTRAEKDRQDTARFSVASFARALLPVADNLRRALDAVPPEARAGNAVYTGVEATERELLRALEANGVKKIDALHKPFDPNLHEVMFEAEDPGHPPGTVVQVMEAGYMIHDRLLRPARVGVAKGVTSPGEQVDREV